MIIDDTYANRQPRVYEDYSPALRSEREGLKTIETISTKGKQIEVASTILAGYEMTNMTGFNADNGVVEVKQLGFMDNGTGQHQSNTVYDENALCPNITTIEGGGTQQIKVMTENVYNFYNNNLKSDGVCGTLTSACSHNGSGTFGVIETQYRIRKLTPRECWRLMDFTDEDFEKAAQVNSNTQLYKQAGNSIPKNLLVAIFGQMLPGKENIYKEN